MSTRIGRLQIEVQDQSGYSAKLWEQAKQLSNPHIQKRINEARLAFPEIPFDDSTASNTVVFNHVLNFYINNHANLK